MADRRLGVDQIEELAQRADDVVAEQARTHAHARGVADVERAARRAVERFHLELYVAAEPLDPPEGGCWGRFAARVSAARSLWHVSGKLGTSRQGRPIVRELAVRPWTGYEAEPTAAVLRALPVTLLRSAALDELRSRSGWLDFWDALKANASFPVDVRVTAAERKAITKTAKLAGARRPQRGRKGGGEAFYRSVTDDAIRTAGLDLPVYVTLAEEYDSDEPSVRRWIATARTRGLLDAKRNVWARGPKYDTPMEHPDGKER